MCPLNYKQINLVPYFFFSWLLDAYNKHSKLLNFGFVRLKLWYFP